MKVNIFIAHSTFVTIALRCKKDAWKDGALYIYLHSKIIRTLFVYTSIRHPIFSHKLAFSGYAFSRYGDIHVVFQYSAIFSNYVVLCSTYRSKFILYWWHYLPKWFGFFTMGCHCACIQLFNLNLPEQNNLLQICCLLWCHVVVTITALITF